MNYGTVTRSKPLLRVVRGFDPNEPTTGQRALPVKDGVTIKSGQVISSKFNGTTARLEWVLGLDASATQGYIALKDATDFDVVSADLLVGLPCSGKFTLETAFYKTGDTYSDGAYLAADGTTGNLKVTTLESGEPIFGLVRVPNDATTNSGLRVVNGTVGGKFVDTYSSVTSPATVLRFETIHLPNTADAT